MSVKTQKPIAMQKPSFLSSPVMMLLVLCAGITVLQIVIVALGGGANVSSIVSGNDGRMYDKFDNYSAEVAFSWIIAVAVTLWLIFHRCNRWLGILLTGLIPFIYVLLVSVLWGEGISPALFGRLQLARGTIDYDSNFVRALNDAGVSLPTAMFLDITNPTAILAAILLLVVALGVYTLVGSKQKNLV